MKLTINSLLVLVLLGCCYTQGYSNDQKKIEQAFKKIKCGKISGSSIILLGESIILGFSG